MILLTAEQVRDVFLENFEKAHETNYDLWEPSTFNWQAIADELNTRAELTCHVEETYQDELWDAVCTLLSCGHEAWECTPKFCPECGAKVIR